MQLIPADQLVTPANRQRRTFDPASLAELAQSIKVNQLLHPIVVRQEDGATILVAGERRLRAIQQYIWLPGETFLHAGQPVPEGMLPCVDMGELDPLQAEEAELEENIRRVDLPWQQRVAATKRLAALRNAQAEARGDPPVSVSSISAEVRTGWSNPTDGPAVTLTRNELIVADHLDDPEVRAAKTSQEAFKLIKRKETAARNVVLAEQVGRVLTSASHTLLNTDAIEWLEEDAETGRYDVIITDPPFGMGADEFGDSGGAAAGAHGYADDETTFLLTHNALIREASRITKPQAHLYIFCDLDRLHWIRAELEAAGWWVHRTPIVWYKGPGSPRIPWPEHGPRRCYELILYAVKGKRPVTKAGYPDVIAIPPTESNLGHSAQKPVALYVNLLQRSVRPGDQVCDPFCGTGPVIPAAHELRCYATAVEKDVKAYGIAVSRVQKLDEQDKLLEGL